MPAGELRNEMAAGVRFAGLEAGGSLVGVMGSQLLQDVILIRHAYVRTARQRRGDGGRLLEHLLETAMRPVMIGTWKAARWAVRFYEKHGFTLIEEKKKTDCSGPTGIYQTDRLKPQSWRTSARWMKSWSAVINRRP